MRDALRCCVLRACAAYHQINFRKKRGILVQFSRNSTKFLVGRWSIGQPAVESVEARAITIFNLSCILATLVV